MQASYPGPDLETLHQEALSAVDNKLTDDQRWAQYVRAIRSEAAKHSRWQLRHHWIINPPPQLAEQIPTRPIQYQSADS